MASKPAAEQHTTDIVDVVDNENGVELTGADPSTREITENNAKDTVEEPYWPNIAAYLQTHKGLQPVVLCVFCTQEIAIPVIQPSSDTREPALKLFCDHIVGRHCWTTYIKGTAASVRKCPFCNRMCDDFGGKVKEAPVGGDDSAGEASGTREVSTRQQNRIRTRRAGHQVFGSSGDGGSFMF